MMSQLDVAMAERLILLVDDDRIVLDSLRLLVQDIGHRAETANSGAEALSKLDSTRYDVVITDSKMPSMDGYAFAQEVRRRHPNVPIILITGSTSPRTSPHISCLMQKPFSLDELRTALSRVAVV